MNEHATGEVTIWHPEVGAYIHGGDKTHKMPSETDGAHATRHTGHEVRAVTSMEQR